ncbi:hypothetical protein A2394_00205 [Candidatus Woesebacteria bacterium RIFOXYB1_FULL_42_36]|uniref:Uncharacterized protein n=1 Tax=Candidatus Woesebacteria bacterium RIFOXYD1_FULL_43_18 TaxID=1802551 RepID=A0A1F8DGI1_9BACT|nr:MAG: hypothetical protein A2394_00205 [Candidatus Woesebacteria bacterium RIFOXYB1_FULL_42_36]OGM83505.1 MAG: hypothetical protein A2421_01660 [Candidatus Woesebacteria bacterium RIFOXYC1_FULL_43_18]OGM87720.1 MAG: hypothetical protein A2573_00440 [Candidatus Woesebacteria bacterium RIFOXYD1_FULL_43_18]
MSNKLLLNLYSYISENFHDLHSDTQDIRLGINIWIANIMDLYRFSHLFLILFKNSARLPPLMVCS